MVKNFVLVPEDIFQSAVAHKNAPSHAPKHARRKHKKSKKLYDPLKVNPKYDVSTQNALYNQNLVSYLKHKKANENRPVPIKMESHPEHFDDTIYVRNQGSILATKDESDIESEASDYSSAASTIDLADFLNPEAAEDMEEEHARRVERRNRRVPLQPPIRVPRPNRRANVTERKKRIEKMAQYIFNIMKNSKNSAKIYRVTDDARILRPDRRGPLAGSKKNDAIFILKQWLGDDPNPYIPAGYESFKRNLRGTEIENLINEGIVQLGGGWVLSSSVKLPKLAGRRVKKAKKRLQKKKRSVARSRTKRSTNRKPKTVRTKLQWPRRKR